MTEESKDMTAITQHSAPKEKAVSANVSEEPVETRINNLLAGQQGGPVTEGPGERKFIDPKTQEEIGHLLVEGKPDGRSFGN
jgi:hypothetical protein